MENTVKIVSEWEDDLCWCPSQCYLRITYLGVNYIIYLRWRHQNPWTAELVQCDENWDMHSIDLPWIFIFKGTYFTDECSLDEIKTCAINNAKRYLYSGRV
jgi:hypothetical protein